MASAIDATKPTSGNALTADVRANFLTAKNEIEALQTADGTKAALAGSASQNFAANALTVAGALGVTGVATFSSNPRVTNSSPRYEFNQSSGAADNKLWDIVAASEALTLRAVNDDGSAAGDILTIQRTGTTIDSFAISATATTVSGTLAVTGKTTLGAPANLKNYTIGTLPAGVRGDVCYVTDQLTTAAAKGAAPTAGGSVVCTVFYNGSAWV